MGSLYSPGIDITEVDKSQYSPAISGTRVYVCGFASKGELYKPMNFTSRAAWLQFYGEPDNEAERYFYNACMEVINQGGLLYCARLPYDNDSLEKYTCKKYKVSSKVKSIQSLENFVDLGESDDLTKYLDGDFAKFGLGGGEAIVKTELMIDSVDLINENENVDRLAFDYYFSKTEDVDDDTDWLAYKQTSIYNRMLDLFKGESSVFLSTAKTIEGLTDDEKATLAAFDPSDLGDFATPEEYVRAFCDGFQTVFGKNTDAFRPWRYDMTDLSNAKYADTNFVKFLKKNEAFFKFIVDNIGNREFGESATAVEKAKSDYSYGNLVPYIYAGTTDEDNNLLGVFTACYNMLGLSTASVNYCQIEENIWQITEDLRSSPEYASEPEVVELVSLVKTTAKFVKATDPAEGETQEDAKIKLATYATKIVRKLEALLDNEKIRRYYDQQKLGGYQETLFAKKCIEVYCETVKIDGTWDLIGMKAAKDLSIFSENTKDDEKSLDADSFDEAISDGLTYFTKYPYEYTDDDGNTKTLDLDGLKYLTVKQLSKTELVECMEDILSHEDWVENMKKEDDEFEKRMNVEDMLQSLKWSELLEEDKTLDRYYSIDSNTQEFLVSIDQVTEWEADETRVPQNTFYIIDKTNGAYKKCYRADGKTHECIGIIPVITTAANGLKAQKIIDANKTGDFQFGLYECLSSIATLNYTDETGTVVEGCGETFLSSDEMAVQLYANDPDANETVSQIAAQQFPSINSTDNGFDRENMKKIGVCVFKAYLDASEGNKISYELVEAYSGELDRNAKNPNTGASEFIDNKVNSQSDYIYFFSNCFASTAVKKDYNETIDILTIEPQKAASLGFYSSMVKEDISLVTSVYDGLNKSFDKVSNIDERDIDIVVDAGMSNIAQYIYTVFGAGGKGAYDPLCEAAAMYKLKNKNSIKTWKTVIQDYFDNFCKRIRKDCMFIADCPRPFALTGNKKIVRPTKPANTIDANLLPYVVYMAGLNTNYGAGYADWFQVTDEFSGDYFWLPPSIKACGIYIYTDENFNYWDAPAGLNRGIVSALDLAFSPNNKQGGELYGKCWNYAVDYPNDGITLWGQKTFQAKPSALDRVNVRRYVLRLERYVYNVLKYFLFEANTATTRQRVVDMLDPQFASGKAMGGLYDYKIICDETVNTPQSIDRNELHVVIGIKPVKAIEYIYVSFQILSTGASWSELT